MERFIVRSIRVTAATVLEEVQWASNLVSGGSLVIGPLKIGQKHTA